MQHRGRPLLRDVRRTRAWPVLATCVIVIAALGLLLREQAQPDGLDSAVDTAMVASFRGHQGVLPWLALPGSAIPLIVVSMAIAVGCLIAGRPDGVLLAATAVPVTAFLDDRVLKHLVGRTHSGQLSFPSGHAASAMTLASGGVPRSNSPWNCDARGRPVLSPRIRRRCRCRQTRAGRGRPPASTKTEGSRSPA